MRRMVLLLDVMDDGGFIELCVIRMKLISELHGNIWELLTDLTSFSVFGDCYDDEFLEELVVSPKRNIQDV
jgi:hypothetical protein